MMFQKIALSLLCAASLATLSGCHHSKIKNPIAQVDSKQPDKVLFDRAADALKHGRYDVARTLLQTMINTYPDSEFIARAKLAIADSWYDEGNSAALQQAEREYKDFETFFPNMKEAAEAQLKIANIHYQQMEKPDRDYTHAMRAQDEYRQLIEQYPDSKLVPEAKQRLREVQEVLAEREFRIGHFYYTRESWPAAIARLKSLADTYPLYSRADEALFLLGLANEQDMTIMANDTRVPPDRRKRATDLFRKDAVQAYGRIITRYPAGNFTDDAAKHLQALHAPIPKATPQAVKQNKAEIASRGETGIRGKVMGNFSRHPDFDTATKVGEPTLEDPRQASAPEISKNAGRILTGQDLSDTNKVSAEIASPTGTAAPSAASATSAPPPAATAATPPPTAPAAFESVPEDPNTATPSSSTTTVPGNDAAAPATPPPAAAAAPSGVDSSAAPAATPAVSSDDAAPQSQTPAAAGNPAGSAPDAAAVGTAAVAPKNANDSSSTKKKKHGLAKLNPF